MALRLRYEIDTPRRLREHLHLVSGAGYFFFPGAAAPQGTPAVLELTFTGSGQSALLRGFVWTRPSAGGIWLELSGAERFLEQVESAPRADARAASEQLVLAQGAGQSALLCRLRDVSAGGARLTAAAGDLGADGTRVRVTLPEAGPLGGQLEAFGRLVWTGKGEAGVEWIRGDLASRAAVRRLLELAEEEWEGARSAAHPGNCRCMKQSAVPSVLLLG